jgi:hypothetical protein
VKKLVALVATAAAVLLAARRKPGSDSREVWSKATDQV